MDHRLPLHKSLKQLEYLEEVVAVKDQIEVALKQSSLAAWKAFPDDANLLKKKLGHVYIPYLILNYYIIST